jgi:hypothetical protein
VEIRAGYDIAFECFHETTMIRMLSIVRPGLAILLSEHSIQFSPNIPSRDYDGHPPSSNGRRHRYTACIYHVMDNQAECNWSVGVVGCGSATPDAANRAAINALIALKDKKAPRCNIRIG